MTIPAPPGSQVTAELAAAGITPWRRRMAPPPAIYQRTRRSRRIQPGQVTARAFPTPPPPEPRPLTASRWLDTLRSLRSPNRPHEESPCPAP